MMHSCALHATPQTAWEDGRQGRFTPSLKNSSEPNDGHDQCTPLDVIVSMGARFHYPDEACRPARRPAKPIRARSFQLHHGKECSKKNMQGETRSHSQQRISVELR